MFLAQLLVCQVFGILGECRLVLRENLVLCALLMLLVATNCSHPGRLAAFLDSKLPPAELPSDVEIILGYAFVYSVLGVAEEFGDATILEADDADPSSKCSDTSMISCSTRRCDNSFWWVFGRYCNVR